jgi:hypothetical protein
MQSDPRALHLALLYAHLRASLESTACYVLEAEGGVFSWQPCISAIEPEWLRVSPEGRIDGRANGVTRTLGHIRDLHQPLA